MAINRVTGTNSGIDVDAVVKASLTTQQNKIDKAYQQQKVYEYQQEQLKEIVNQCTDFYDKYLDILSGDSLLKSSAYESVSFTGSDNNITAKGFAGADASEYSVTVNSVASKASTVLGKEYFSGNETNLSVKVGEDVEVSITTTYNKTDVDLEKTAKDLNEKLKEKGTGLTAKYSSISGGIVIESDSTGAKQVFSVGKGGDTINYDRKGEGSDASITVKKKGMPEPGITLPSSSTNTIIADGIEFTVNKESENVDGVRKPTVLTGKDDSSTLKDTIIKFVNDYNKLLQSINDKLLEKRDTDYMPLTEDQKSDMSESEIKKWEEKAQTGLLRNDSDLKRIQSALKDSMRTLMDDSGLNLEKIGIKPVDNYGSKNGTFTIDEDTLSKAIESNAEGVKDLFTRAATKDEKGKIDTSIKNANGGVLIQLQDVLKNETKISGSSLSKRIGFSGTSTENNNTMKTYIEKQKKLITELKAKYTDRETALYNKYSSLETMLEKLNAQSNSLYSMLNIG